MFRERSLAMIKRIPALLLGSAAVGLMLAPPSARAASAQVTQLVDVSFGTITNFSSDITNSQSICVYSTQGSGKYNVTATGSGNGGAFTLSSGSNTLAYQVQWADSPNQTTGVSLSPGVTQNVLRSSATNAICAVGLSSSASLITILTADAVGSATAGDYSGTLTLLIAPN
jgi:hypothetical protein